MAIFRYSILLLILFIIYGCSEDAKIQGNSHSDSINQQSANPNSNFVEKSADRTLNLDDIIPFEPTEEQIASLRETGTAPFVINLRKAFNDFVKGNKKSKYIDYDFLIIEKNEIEYLRSKFFIISIEQNGIETATLDILFKDKPNRIFTCVMRNIDGIYQLKYFNVNIKYRDFDIKILLKQYEKYFKLDIDY